MKKKILAAQDFRITLPPPQMSDRISEGLRVKTLGELSGIGSLIPVDISNGGKIFGAFYSFCMSCHAPYSVNTSTQGESEIRCA
jgi:hypothetical protein